MCVYVWVCAQEDRHLQGPEEDISSPGAGLTGACAALDLGAGNLLTPAGKAASALNHKPSLQPQEQVLNAMLTDFLYIFKLFQRDKSFNSIFMYQALMTYFPVIS